MDTLQEFGIRLILVLQQLSPTLDSAMNFFTFLGNIEFYLIIIPFIYWAVDKRLGFRLLLILVSTYFVSSIFKLLFHQPRPYWLGKVMKLAEETSYGIPSSHASGSLAVWGYTAYWLKKTWLWILIGMFVLFIGISRLYLGVHFPHDVLTGWLLGVVILWVFFKAENGVSSWANQKSIGTQIGLGLSISLAVILVGWLVQTWLTRIPDPPEWSAFAAEARTATYFFTLAGSLFGSISGYVLMKQHARFENQGSGLQHLGRYALGILVMLFVYYSLDILFAMIAADESLTGYVLRYTRYAIVTFLVTFIAPWIFLKIGLARPQPADTGERVVRTHAQGQNP